MYAKLSALILFLLASLPVAAMELVMVEEDGCLYCARWKQEIGGIYPKTPEAEIAPLDMVNIRDLDAASFTVEQRVVYTPTFLLVDEGREIARIEGYPGETLFWWALQSMLTAHTDFTVPVE